ncbi:MAG: LLM class flavin-dependent oxidoreductase [Candidatus Caldarchaeum sp.]|nr:LLM class flavin-dependent oxidoreductase [Candidatus Caldarchaeum sp.]
MLHPALLRTIMDVSYLSWCLRNNDFDSRTYASLAKEAENMGYYGFFSVEGTDRKALPHLITGNIRSAFINNAAAALATSKIKLGTSIVSIYSRTPLATSFEAATLNELSNGRFILGVGVGGPWLVEKGYGYPLDRPAVRMKEFLTIVKQALSGAKVDFQGEFYKVVDVRLEQLHPSAPPVLMAGLNPAMLKVGGMLADGVILNMFPTEALEFAREKISEGAEKAGRNPRDVKLYVLAACGVSDEPTVVNSLKTGIAFYCHISTHHKFLAYAGLQSYAEKIQRVWSEQGPEKAAEEVNDLLLERLTLGYTPEKIAYRCKEYLSKGAYPLIYPHFDKENGKQKLLRLMHALTKA